MNWIEHTRGVLNHQDDLRETTRSGTLFCHALSQLGVSPTRTTSHRCHRKPGIHADSCRGHSRTQLRTNDQPRAGQPVSTVNCLPKRNKVGSWKSTYESP